MTTRARAETVPREARSPATGDGACSRVVESLLADRGGFGCRSVHPYKKWQGAFWRLISLVELKVDPEPRTDEMLDGVLAWLTSDGRRKTKRNIAGRERRSATQEGLGLWLASRLGKAMDPRAWMVANSLVEWQWPDGGWNCDIRPRANRASFHESHGPIRGLAEYYRATGDTSALRTAEAAAEFFLAHRLFRSHRNGGIIHPEYLNLHWPSYWFYDILVGLRTVGEVRDLQCLKPQKRSIASKSYRMRMAHGDRTAAAIGRNPEAAAATSKSWTGPKSLAPSCPSKPSLCSSVQAAARGSSLGVVAHSFAHSRGP